MGYGKRLDVLFSHLEQADVFADVGCDHGYASEYMLKSGLCNKAILSDISRGSLKKAETLLEDYVQTGRAVPVLGDGFVGVPKDVDEVLIAGMGGCEIVSILSHPKHGFIPKRFVLQPMHDSELVRRFLIEHGAYIDRDYTFFDGKYYDVIVGRKADGQAQAYTDAEAEFGRDNIKERGEAFLQRLQKLTADIDKYLESGNLQPSSREELLQRKKRYQGVYRGEIK